jgi:hypothetical protein
MRKSTRGRWSYRLVSVALALMGFAVAVGNVVTAQDFEWR